MKLTRQATKEEAKEIMARVIRASGYLYMDAYKTLEAEFGLEGVMCIRQWLRRWGVWRGQQARKGHLALGLPLNVDNLVTYWDSAAAIPEAAFESFDKSNWRPCEVSTITKDGPGACEQADVWREHDFWLQGHIYCDEFHIKYAQGYHPQAICAIPENIMKNDSYCYHHFVLPDNYMQGDELMLPLYEGEDPAADWAQSPPDQAQIASFTRKGRITAGRIYFLKEVIYEKFPEEADRLFGKIMTDWCRDRGVELAEYLAKQGLEATVENLIANFDQPLVYLHGAELETEGDTSTVTLGKCPFAETFKWLDQSGSPALYEHFCQHCCQEMFHSIDPRLNVRLTDCQMQGHDHCRFNVTTTKE